MMTRALVIGLAAAALLGIAGCASLTGSPKTVEDRIAASLDKWADRQSDPAVASVLVHSPQLDLDVFVQKDDGQPDAFHLASVGKLFTMAVIGMLIDDGELEAHSRVAELLPPGTLSGLFVVDGVDYQDQVTVLHLLSHTSGAGDYFSDPASDGMTMFERLVAEPDEMWTAERILDFARSQNTAVARPGEMYHYSDTGFAILGFVAESVTGRTFDDIITRDIVEPLGLARTWMPYRTTPSKGEARFRRAWFSGVEVSTFRSVSADWAGGGIASTEEDLLVFVRALWSGELVSKETLASFQRFDHTFERGILYGAGIMQLHFRDFSRLLASYPDMVGHMGLLATQAFYDPEHDLTVIVNLGSDEAIEDSVRLVIEVVGSALRAVR